MSDSISVRQGTQIIPIVPNVVRRHRSLAARGLLVEHHAVEPTEFPEREPQQHNFFMYTSPAVRAEIKSPDFSGMRWVRPGVLWVMPQASVGIPLTSFKDDVAATKRAIVKHTPGHKKGSVSVELGNKEALVGDLVASGILMGGVIRLGHAIRPPFEDDPQAVNNELLRLVDAGIDRFYMGHGGPLDAREVRRHAETLVRTLGAR